MDAAPGREAIGAQTSLGRVRLTVADLASETRFYEAVLGLTVLDQSADTVTLGADAPIVELHGDPDAPRRPRGTTGLFHLALLVPTRRDLARALGRLANAGWRLSGASDHLVSEALYLDDAEGNGIEIYRDRPREEWRFVGGALQMATLPLDLGDLLSEPGGDRGGGMAAGTRLGHIHLNVSDLAAAERFYSGLIGFEVTVRGYPGALFVSAGGYHHHIGLNTWAGEGAPPPPPGARGLRSFELVLSGADELERLLGRLAEGGCDTRRERDAVVVHDPSGTSLRLLASSPLPRASASA